MIDVCHPSPWSYQLARDATGRLIDKNGPVNCAAHACADGLECDSCGRINVTGAKIRSLTNEPRPDSSSPGLHHGQLRDACAKLGVRLEVIYGASWDEVRDVRKSGRTYLIQVNYLPIRLTPYSGQRNFYGNHELMGRFDLIHDPLADGRLSGGKRVWRSPGTYPESLLKQAAGAFITARYPSGGIKSRLGFGRANIAVFPHTMLPDTSTPVVTPPSPWNGKERNVAILTAYKGHTFRLAKDQALYRHPSGPVVTVMSATGSVEYIGKAGAGWVAVRVGTKALYADGIVRPTVLYCPSGAGVLE